MKGMRGAPPGVDPTGINLTAPDGHICNIRIHVKAIRYINEVLKTNTNVFDHPPFNLMKSWETTNETQKHMLVCTIEILGETLCIGRTDAVEVLEEKFSAADMKLLSTIVLKTAIAASQKKKWIKKGKNTLADNQVLSMFSPWCRHSSFVEFLFQDGIVKHVVQWANSCSKPLPEMKFQQQFLVTCRNLVASCFLSEPKRIKLVLQSGLLLPCLKYAFSKAANNSDDDLAMILYWVNGDVHAVNKFITKKDSELVVAVEKTLMKAKTRFNRKNILLLHLEEFATTMKLMKSRESSKPPDNSDRSLRMCRKCGADRVKIVGKKMLKCSRCKMAWYCSKECQRADWAGHKQECTPMSDFNRKDALTQQHLLTGIVQAKIMEIHVKLAHVARIHNANPSNVKKKYNEFVCFIDMIENSTISEMPRTSNSLFQIVSYNEVIGLEEKGLVCSKIFDEWFDSTGRKESGDSRAIDEANMVQALEGVHARGIDPAGMLMFVCFYSRGDGIGCYRMKMQQPANLYTEEAASHFIRDMENHGQRQMLNCLRHDSEGVLKETMEMAKTVQNAMKNVKMGK